MKDPQTETKDKFILWQGDEIRISLQGGGFAATLHFKPGYCEKPFKIPGALWPDFRKKVLDAIMTGKCIVLEDGKKVPKLKEDKKKVDLENELKEIPKPDSTKNDSPVSTFINRNKEEA